MVISKSQSKNYCTEISNQETVIYSDVKQDAGGSGQYFRPDELLCSSLAACLNMTIRMGLDYRKLQYEQIVIQVDLDRSDDNKTKFLFDIDVTGDVSGKAKQTAKQLAKACPIRKMLSKEIQFEEKKK